MLYRSAASGGKGSFRRGRASLTVQCQSEELNRDDIEVKEEKRKRGQRGRRAAGERGDDEDRGRRRDWQRQVEAVGQLLGFAAVRPCLSLNAWRLPSWLTFDEEVEALVTKFCDLGASLCAAVDAVRRAAAYSRSKSSTSTTQATKSTSSPSFGLSTFSSLMGLPFQYCLTAAATILSSYSVQLPRTMALTYS